MPVSFLSQCFSEIKKWMSGNLLCLNSDKTEVMLIGSPHQLHKAESATLGLDGSALQFQTKQNFSSQKHCQITSHVDFFCG